MVDFIRRPAECAQRNLSRCLKNGPYLRNEEGHENAVLCNDDDLAEETHEKPQGPEYEVVPAPNTPHREAKDCKLSPDSGTSRSPETELVYARDDVAVWPAKNRCINGRLSLIKQNSVLFLAWLPYSQSKFGVEDSEPSETATDVAATPVSQGQYAVHPIPLSDLKAIRKQTPKLGNHHLVLILKNGLTLPSFYFSSGGVRGLFSVLKQHVVLTKSTDSSSTYLINDMEDPLQRSLATLDLSDALMLDPSHLPTFAQSSKGQQGGDGSTQMALMGRMKDGMQRATQFAWDTTSALLPSPKQAAQPEVANPGGAIEDSAETAVGQFEMVDRSESESMSSGPSQPCPPPLTQDEWFTFLDSSGRVVDSKALRLRIFTGGVEPSIRKEAWKYLLGLYPEGSTAAYRAALTQKRAAEYERIKAQWTSISDKQAARFGKWRERCNRVDKDVRRTDCSQAFFAGEDNPNVAILRRVLLTYSMYNFDLGYCQGMSDLAAPILVVMRDEALAFWCFAHLMERFEANFHTDCTGMHAQLAALDSLVKLLDPELHAFLEAKGCTNFFFCYRWLLVHFKREFDFEEALQLWEALWSCPLTPHFHIYMCAAVLCMQRRRILDANMGFDDLLGFCIQLAGQLDLGRTLRCAEHLFRAAGDAGTRCLSAANLP